MCVICYKPIGKVIKSRMLQYCFNTNRDGAGYMYPKDGKVIIKKGFMTFHDLMESVRATVEELGGSSRETPMIFHFRIGTQGGTVPELTHPYPVCDSYDEMKKTDNICDIAMAHNGILMECSNRAITDHNDSMEFIKRFANPIIDNDLSFVDDKLRCQEISELSSPSRLIFLTKEGRVLMTGNWVNYEGYMFSHPVYYMSYLDRPSYKTSPKKPKKASTSVKTKSYKDLDLEDDNWLTAYLNSLGNK